MWCSAVHARGAVNSPRMMQPSPPSLSSGLTCAYNDRWKNTKRSFFGSADFALAKERPILVQEKEEHLGREGGREQVCDT